MRPKNYSRRRQGPSLCKLFSSYAAIFCTWYIDENRHWFGLSGPTWSICRPGSTATLTGKDFKDKWDSSAGFSIVGHPIWRYSSEYEGNRIIHKIPFNRSNRLSSSGFGTKEGHLLDGSRNSFSSRIKRGRRKPNTIRTDGFTPEPTRGQFLSVFRAATGSKVAAEVFRGRRCDGIRSGLAHIGDSHRDASGT